MTIAHYIVSRWSAVPRRREYVAAIEGAQLWTADRERAMRWPELLAASAVAAAFGGEVWEVRRVEADLANLPRDALIAMLEEAQGEIGRLMAARDAAQAHEAEAVAHAGVLRAALRDTAEALADYGQHEAICFADIEHGAPCTCGLLTAIEAPRVLLGRRG